jgi:uroporphyrin-III C-methyltransferase/precorrin-2 dehydrogenase/sirohydrochlorin ferrochelatase/uroporphyrin-III C-methyltransferase
VYLVGAGPGDPELLTLKAVRALERADVVVYDRLVSADVLAMVPTGTMRIFVGKACARHAMPQDEINALLVRLARAGHRVVRLKGGDPFVFGRGSEEATHLARHGVAVEVVPGVTAASACCAALGIPLTHRGLASGVRFVTGHSRSGALDLDWDRLADPDTTLVIYMGLANLPLIARRLEAAGLAPDTPAAAIAGATLPEQAVCVAPLARLPEAVREAGLAAPVLVVIGRVVALAAEVDPRAHLAEADGAVVAGG